jgi:hypothetical protein
MSRFDLPAPAVWAGARRPGLPRQRPPLAPGQRQAPLLSKNGTTRQRDVGLVGTPGLSGVWRHLPGGFTRESGKSQMAKIVPSPAVSWSWLAGKPITTTCGDAVQVDPLAPRAPPPNPEGCLRRAKQRANGVRLRATPTDTRRRSPQVKASSGDARRRRNTQKIWFASRRPGVRVPLAPPQVKSLTGSRKQLLLILVQQQSAAIRSGGCLVQPSP